MLVFFSLFISCKNNEYESEEDKIRKKHPVTPKELRVSRVDETSVTLLWDQTEDHYYITNYEVECRDSSEILIKSKTVKDTYYTFSNLIRGTTYKFRIRTNKNDEHSKWSEYITAKPKIDGVKYSDLTSSSVTLEWDDNPLRNIDYYFVKCTEKVSGDERIIKCTSRDTCTITGLCTNVEYGFSVCGQMGSSYAIIGGQTLGIPSGTTALNLSTPNNVIANTSGKSITVSWNSVKGATRYFIAVYNKGLTPFNYVQTDSTSYTFTTLSSGTYKFSIRADNPNSYLYSHWSGMAQATTF